jgi:hypothetical protein
MHFPPGYPCFIACLMKCGAGSTNAVKIANGALLYLSMILLFFSLATAGKNNLVAFTATAFAISQASVLRFATIMMSETLFMFLSFAVLTLILHWDIAGAFTERRKRLWDVARLCLLCAALGYIYFVRAMGQSLLLAVVLYYGIMTCRQWLSFRKARKQERRDTDEYKAKKTVLWKYALVLGAVVVSYAVPKALWDIRNQRLGKSENEYVGTFYMNPGGQTISTLSGWRTRITNNAVSYTTKYIPSALFGHSVDANEKATLKEWLVGAGCLLLLLLLGLYRLPKGALLLFLYGGITMGVLLLYPEQYAGHRYMTPVIPLLLFLFIYGASALLHLTTARVTKRKAKWKKYAAVWPWVACAAFSLAAFPSYASAIQNAEASAKFKDYTLSNASPALVEYIEAIRWVRDNVPATARVSTRKSELFYIYSGGRKSIIFPYYGTPEEIIDFFTKHNVNCIIIDRWFRHAHATVIPAVQKYQDKFKILRQINGSEKDAAANYVLEFNPAWGYTGDRLDGKPHGQGVWVLQDGRTYTGSFVRGIVEGYGVMTGPDGKVLAKGIWRDGTLVKPQ